MSNTHADNRRHRRKAWRRGTGVVEHALRLRRRWLRRRHEAELDRAAAERRARNWR